MKITREQLKGIVREVMTEESEYQTFFKKALEKTGKSIPQMSDEEKKAFFNKIDKAWKGKGEKRESVNEAMNLGVLPKWIFDDPNDFEEWYDSGMELGKKGTKLAPFSKSDEKKLFDLLQIWTDSYEDSRFGGGSKNDVNNQIKQIGKFLKQKGKVIKESVNESLLKEWKLEVDLGKVNPNRFDRFVDKSFQKSFKIDVAGSDTNRVIIGRGKDDSEGISAGFLADKLEGQFGNKIKMKIDGKPLKFRGL